MFENIMKEITPLTKNDCFTVFSRTKKEFSFPLHSHEEMELNLILEAAGAQRVVGDHVGDITDAELVLVGSNLPHGWFTHKCSSNSIREVTIQFHKELLTESLLEKNQLVSVKRLFENAKRGVLFSADTIATVSKRILDIKRTNGFDSLLELLSILHDLSIARNTNLLSDITFSREMISYDSRRLQRVFDYMNQKFADPVTLCEVAKVANMTDASFSRFVKQHTGYTFTEKLAEIRLGHVSRMLIDTKQSVAEIAYKCGFNNMANFNKIFKQYKGCTPKEFRKTIYGQRIFV